MSLSLEQESSLVERAKFDGNAFLILYEHYLPQIYRYAYYRAKSKQEAEDVVSQTFLQALENIQGYRQQGLPLGHWLYRIAGNIIFQNNRRKEKEHRLLGNVGRGETAEITTEQLDLLDLLEQLHELPDAQQQVLTLRYIQDLSIREVARIMNRSEGAVKQLTLRALTALRERMSDDE